MYVKQELHEVVDEAELSVEALNQATCQSERDWGIWPSFSVWAAVGFQFHIQRKYMCARFQRQGWANNGLAGK